MPACNRPGNCRLGLMNSNRFESSRIADGMMARGAQHAGAALDPQIEAYITELKSKIPAEDHWTIDARVQALLDDPDVTPHEVTEILGKEFNPAPNS